MNHPDFMKGPAGRSAFMPRRALVLCAAVLALAGCAATPKSPADHAAASNTDAAADAKSANPDKSDDLTDDQKALSQWQSDYAALLSTCVTRHQGLVRYRVLLDEKASIHKLVKDLAPARHFDSAADHTAYLINAYNLLVMAQVVDRWPVRTTMHEPGFYDQQQYRVFGEILTLGQLSERKIMPRGDVRLRMALVQGAMGSPPLRIEPYAGDQLDAQLNDQCARFVNDGVHVTLLGDTLLISPLFDWYRKAFSQPPYGSITGFISLYAEPGSDLAAATKGQSDLSATFQPFNWALNSGD